jgi:archaemetzincin
MKSLVLLPVGDVDRGLVEDLRRPLASEFLTAVGVDTRMLDPAFAFHIERQQYHSTEIVDTLRRFRTGDTHILGITPVDLFIPILTFVFGEAELKGHCAVASYHRLRQEYYGLEPDRSVLFDRLLKESVHETGHTVGLTHCDNYECAMATSHGVEWIDLKGRILCPRCRTAAGLQIRFATY